MACANGICSVNNKCGRDAGEGPCDVATQAAICQSGVCNAATMQCQPMGTGSCTRDADCDMASYCNRSTFSCVPKVDNGVSIPSDGVHDGTCDNAPAVCASGLCNPSLKVCGAPNGDECTTATSCASNICAGRVCGAPNGLTCTLASECSSNLCTDGVCGPGPAPVSVGGSGGCGIGGEGHSPLSASLAVVTLLMLGLGARRRRRHG
jgi:MYXO-CTERM domain-containing protein